MTDPLKRTGLRSSPEDAAFYRKFHDPALASIRKEVPRDQILRDLVSQGVPEKTAERIVVAVEQEHALIVNPPGLSRWQRWALTAAFIGFFGGLNVVVAWQMSEDGSLKPKYLIAGTVVVMVLGAIVIQKLLLKVRGPEDLPPPPDRPA